MVISAKSWKGDLGLFPERGWWLAAEAEPDQIEAAAQAAEAAADQVRASHEGPLSERTWGEANTARICHPLAGALPGPVGRALCMPADALPGDAQMPRVQGPAFGASQRMVVSPGREAEGVFHLPGGQVGHPLSPFWGAGHADWGMLTGRHPAPHILHNPLKAFHCGRPFILPMPER